jgi:predicted MFS family arabinose efflux permease
MPAVATDVLHVGAAELAWLLAARGAGTLAGSLAIASLGRVRDRAASAAICALTFGAVTAVFAVQRALAPALVLAGAMGVAQFAFSGFSNVLVQTTVPDHVRGRVLSLYLVTVTGVTPLGVLLLGIVSSATGIDVAVAIGSLVLIAGGASALVGIRRQR